MIALNARHHDLLARICRAGSEGAVLEQGELGDAIMLGLEELITITKDRPQRGVITERGRAFSRRTAA